MNKTKTCNRCDQEKPLNGFYKDATASDGRGYTCKECKAKYNKKYRDENRKKILFENKKRALKHRYGITYDEYVSMYNEQNGKCGICEEEYKLGGYSGLYVDHCHETGKVRGLLCPRCNSLLGKFMEDRKIIEKALEYLES